MTSENGSASTPLAIVGIGCLFPKAADSRAFWLNIKNGVDSIGPVPATHWNPDDYLDADPKSPDRTYAARGGFLDAVDFRPLDFGIAPNDLEATDTSQLLGLVAAKQALIDAGYGPERNFDRNRVSVILGVTGTLELVVPLGARLGHPKWKKALANAGIPDDKAKQIVDEISDSYVGWQENSFPGLLGNVVAGRIANRLDLGGTNCVVDAACASSLSAIHLAGLELAAGRCDVAVSGGVDTFNDIFMFMCFSKTPALSPTGDAKPFDAKGDGTILGEGLGIVVLKRLADAERDGDRIYAVLRGVGSSSDGKGNAIYAPSSAGQTKALRNAYELAGVTPDTIELVEAHGTGTRVGDAAEVSALTEVYRASKPEGTWCAVGSVKSQIGHTKAAAGAAGLIKAALALHHQVLPPTIKVSDPIEALRSGNSPLYANIEKRPWIAHPDHPRRAAVSAFGFGGSNFHCVLEEHKSKTDEIDWEGDVEIIAISGENSVTLTKALEGWKTSKPWADVQRAAAASRLGFSTNHACRLLLVVNRETHLPKLTESARAKLDTETNAKFWRLPEGAYFGAGPFAGKLAVLFPGQGSQYVGMMRDLACSFPAVREVLADANRVYARMTSDTSSERLSDMIYPHPAFSNDEREEREQRLRNTQVAQPAIGAVSLGALKVFEGFGLNPDAYAGHSYGELPALCAAGCFDAESLHTMSRLRGHLMASYHGGDAGCMLAVHAPLNAIETMLHEESLDLVVANRNAPSQSVLSGSRVEIDRAVACLDRRQLRHTRLAVAAAFHSPLVASARQPFRKALGELPFGPAKKAVFANTSGQPYPNEPEAIRELLAGQLACPVDFVREIGSMAKGGVRTFLEVGPGSTLTKLVNSILSAPEQIPAIDGWDAFALDASTGKRSGMLDLAHALARLAAHGYALDLSKWRKSDETRLLEERSSKPGFSVPICGANYVSPKAKKSREISQPPVTSPKTPTFTEPVTPARIPVSATKPMHDLPTTRAAAVSSAVNPDALAQALNVTQQSMAAFQKLQEQTANLHRQFLENQEAAQRTLQMLVEQQHSLLTGAAVTPLTMPITKRSAPAPITPPTVSRSRWSEPETQTRETSRTGDHRPTPPKPVKVVPSSLPKHDASAILLAVIAEKTGYPVEMLTPEMALDADLGIDSIKRVEIFSALQERLPNAPIVKPEHLGTLHTVRDVVAFLSSGAPAPEPEALAQEMVPGSDQILTTLFAVVAEKTGYPPEMLNAEMALDADLGIDSIKRVEIFSALQERLPDAPIVKPENLGTLHTLGEVVAFLGGLNDKRSDVEAAKKKLVEPEPAPQPEPVVGESANIERLVLRAVPLTRSASNPVRLADGSTIVVVAQESPAVLTLVRRIQAAGHRPLLVSWNDSPAASNANEAAGLVLFAPDQSIDDLPLKGFRWMRQFAASLKRSAGQGGALLATVSRLDGAFGLTNQNSKGDARTGALAGLTKTASHEWPGVACKAIDIEPDSLRLADVWDEIAQRGPLEVGISAKGKIALELKQEPVAESGAPFSSKDVIVITGGARGVTAAVAETIAGKFRPTLVLLGRTEIDGAESVWLNDCTTETAIKQALSRNLKPTPLPKVIEAEYRRIAGQREALSNIAQMKKAGARVVYRALDVTDASSIETVLAKVRLAVGPITALIHGAGILADRRIEDLTDEQFTQVYSTKVAGIESLLAALKSDPLKAIVLFSSSTGRFGRTGQIAYAAANESLNKIAQEQARFRANCKVVAINWGPWDGGMITPALRKLFENEGVGAIPLRQGADVLLRELNVEKSAVEVTVIARPAKNEVIASPAVPLHLAFELELNLRDHPVLRSHVIDGRPVLPLALHMEWLAHAALHGSPGLVFHGVNDLRVLNGVHLDEGHSSHLKIFAGNSVRSEAGFVVSVELRGRRGSREIVHSRAEVLLVPRLPAAPSALAMVDLETYPHPLADIYRYFLFHGPDLAGIEAIEGVSDTAIVGSTRTAPAPSMWLRQPLRAAWIADPQIVDSAFQMMILWSFAEHGSGCLPCFVGSYRQYRRALPAGSIQIRIRIKSENGSMARADIEFLDAAGAIVAAMENHESVIDEKLNKAFRKNRLIETSPIVGGEHR